MNPREIVEPVPADGIDYDSFITKDDTPVDNFFVERQYRLLTGPLYLGWNGPGEGRTYQAVANVGLFYDPKIPPFVPDMMLSLDVPTDLDYDRKENQSYFVWRFGKPPDLIVEIVSDRRGGEDTVKFEKYAEIGISYYVIFDPRGQLSDEVLRSFVRNPVAYVQMPDNWYSSIGLGLTLWEGVIEGAWSDHWLRWCDERGQVIPTGHELANRERRRADEQQRKADEQQRKVEEERLRADAEHRRAEDERRQRERLEAMLRERGIDPNA